MVKILIVNCHISAAGKLDPYIKMVQDIAEYEVVSDMRFHEVKKELFDGILISGSERNVSMGEHHPILFEYLKKPDIPVIGICYGHHLLAKAQGLRVARLLFPIKKEITLIVRRDPIFDGLPLVLKVPEAHTDYVVCEEKKAHEKGIIFLSKYIENGTCMVEVLRKKNEVIYGFQFHMERSLELGRKIFQNFVKMIKK